MSTNIMGRFERSSEGRMRVWHSFCEQTPFHGFMLIRDSKFKLEKAIWLMLVAVAIAVTFRDTIKTVRDYMEEETLSKATMKLNESIILPNPTVCMEFGFNISEFTFENYSEPELFFEVNKDKILYYFEDLPQTIETLLTDQVGAWPIQNEANMLVSIVYLTQLLDVSDLVERHITQVNHSAPNMCTYKGYYSYSCGLWQFFNKNNISLADAKKAAGLYICAMIYLTPFTDITIMNWCHRRYITALTDKRFGGHLLCIRGSQDENRLNFSSRDSWFSISPYSISEPIAVYSMFVDFDRPQIVADDKGPNSVFSDSNAFVAAEVITTRQYSTKRSPCGNEKNFEDCRSKCLEDFVLERCGCITLSAFYLYCSDGPCNESICLSGSGFTFKQNTSDTIVKQISCKAEFTVNEDLKSACEQQCPPPCLGMHLELTRPVTEFKPDDHRKDISVTFTVPRRTYLKIEQTLAMDTQTFMSNLGGNLGLYIGGTFLALCHLISSLIHFFVSLARAKETASDPVQSMEFHDCSHIQAVVVQLKEKDRQREEEIRQLREEIKNICKRSHRPVKSK